MNVAHSEEIAEMKSVHSRIQSLFYKTINLVNCC